ncbi:MAG TPA: 50S ribosomal protein L10, partial [Firmicutes bacterium]|nr:50S ribosomal protein L10 [Bacillota bacterium]
MARPEKEAAVAEIQKKLSSSQSVILTDYRGLNVQEVTELRKKLREVGVEFKVVKNTLTKLAAKNAAIEGLDDLMEGPIALAFGYDDPVAPAKVLAEFAKDHQSL